MHHVLDQDGAPLAPPIGRLIVGVALLAAAMIFAVARALAGHWQVNGSCLWAVVFAIVGVVLVSQHVHETACDDSDGRDAE